VIRRRLRKSSASLTPGEAITYGHDQLGAPTKTSGVDLYASNARYTDFGQMSQLKAGDSTNEAEALYSYDEYTLRLTGRSVYRTQAPGPLVDQLDYSYDDAGKQLSVTDDQSESGNTTTDLQCFQYDGLARLTNAWTGADTCGGQLAAGTGSYSQSYTYDNIGDRTRLVDHSTTGGTDVTTTYTNGCSNACNRSGAQPHTLTATGGGTDPTKFVYDVDGNLLSRAATSGAGQTLTWDDEGLLASVTTTKGSTSAVTKYLYDANGNQLIRRDPGRTTLFVGDTQILVDTSIAPAVSLGAVRTYTLGGGGAGIAERSTLPGGGTSYLFNDPHGTATLAVDTTTQKVSRQQYKPYGEIRGSANTTAWPDLTHGYRGAATDLTTGYTDLGARKYDPALGRFINVDPLLETTDANQLGGYTYAGDDPVDQADPTGLAADFCATATCASQTAGGLYCADCESGAIDAEYGASIDLRVLNKLDSKQLAQRAKVVDAQLAQSSASPSHLADESGDAQGLGVLTGFVHAASDTVDFVARNDYAGDAINEKWNEYLDSRDVDQGSIRFVEGELEGYIGFQALAFIPTDRDSAVATAAEDLERFGSEDGPSALSIVKNAPP
jgi:RHS repeat-associated protein